jgi:hypothetical protein
VKFPGPTRQSLTHAPQQKANLGASFDHLVGARIAASARR